MLPNAFIDRPEKPTDGELTAELGPVKPLWDQLIARLAAECHISDQEWTASSRKSGWALRLKVKKRNILYLSPCHGAFRAALVLGDRAVEAARHSKLPRKTLESVNSAQRYPEGTAVRIEVNGVKDIPAIVKLAAIKLRY